MPDHLDQLVDMDSMPMIGEQGIDNIIHQIRYIHETDDDGNAIDRARFSLRAIACILPPGQNDPLSVAFIAGFMGCQTLPFLQALTATGQYSGEMGFEKLQAFITQCIGSGDHPRELAELMGLDMDEYHTIAHLLDLEFHWQETVGDRVFIAYMSGEPLREIRRLAKCNYWEARRWRAWAAGTADKLIDRMR